MQGAFVIEPKGRFAQMRFAFIAIEAAPAGANERDNDRIAHIGQCDAGTNLDDDPGRFVSIDGRQCAPQAPSI